MGAAVEAAKPGTHKDAEKSALGDGILVQSRSITEDEKEQSDDEYKSKLFLRVGLAAECVLQLFGEFVYLVGKKAHIEFATAVLKPMLQGSPSGIVADDMDETTKHFVPHEKKDDWGGDKKWDDDKKSDDKKEDDKKWDDKKDDKKDEDKWWEKKDDDKKDDKTWDDKKDDKEDKWWEKKDEGK